MTERIDPARAALSDCADWIRIPREDRRAWRCEPYQRSPCRDTIARMQDATPIGAYAPSGTVDLSMPTVPRRVRRYERAIKGMPWPLQDAILRHYVEREPRRDVGAFLPRAEDWMNGWLEGYATGWAA